VFAFDSRPPGPEPPPPSAPALQTSPEAQGSPQRHDLAPNGHVRPDIDTRFSSERQPSRRGRTGSTPSRFIRRTGQVRIYRDHRSSEAIAYRRHLAALSTEYDLTSPVAKILAGQAAAAYVVWTEASVELSRAKAGRPTARQVERLRRRLALQAKSYEQALCRLHEFTGAAQMPASGPRSPHAGPSGA
jgi:hypothetical protein